jgi:DNA-binding NtrC family response regulator
MTKNNPPARVLIIEDDEVVSGSLKRLLEQDYEVEAVSSAEGGITRAQQIDFDVVVTDLQMPGASGMEVIRMLHPVRPHLPIILMTGHHTTDVAIEAIKVGAYDYLLKPIEPREFVGLIEKAAASRALLMEPDALDDSGVSVKTIVGRSAAMQKVFKEIGRIAAKPVTVLIRGETGTGKELVARALYQHSERSQEPFVIVNCVAIPESLLESELFGHEAGAFTGAQNRRVGKFEQAGKGTIFLDEIGDINRAMQAKLLRVLQEKTIRRVGGQEVINVEARVIAATHRNLEQAVAEKKFREDLYYRLNDAVIHVPALRERREDIPELVRYFLSRLQEQVGHGQTTITPETLRVLQYRAWPGNVRELRNLLHKAVLLAHGYPIDPEIVRRAVEQTSLTPQQSKPFLQAHIAEILEGAERDGATNIQSALTQWAERELYEQAIQLAEGDQTKVAKWLGVSRPTVRERLLHYGLHPGQDRIRQTQEPTHEQSAGH